MNSPTLGLRVSSVVFGLLGAGQAARLLFQAQVVVNGWELPLWPSALAALVLGALCLWLRGLAAGSGCRTPG